MYITYIIYYIYYIYIYIIYMIYIILIYRTLYIHTYTYVHTGPILVFKESIRYVQNGHLSFFDDSDENRMTELIKN